MSTAELHAMGGTFDTSGERPLTLGAGLFSQEVGLSSSLFNQPFACLANSYPLKGHFASSFEKQRKYCMEILGILILSMERFS